MKFVIYRDERKEWRWSLKASNGRIVADSAEGYKRRGGMWKGLDLVRKSNLARITYEKEELNK